MAGNTPIMRQRPDRAHVVMHILHPKARLILSCINRVTTWGADSHRHCRKEAGLVEQCFALPIVGCMMLFFRLVFLPAGAGFCGFLFEDQRPGYTSTLILCDAGNAIDAC